MNIMGRALARGFVSLCIAYCVYAQGEWSGTFHEALHGKLIKKYFQAPKVVQNPPFGWFVELDEPSREKVLDLFENLSDIEKMLYDDIDLQCVRLLTKQFALREWAQTNIEGPVFLKGKILEPDLFGQLRAFSFSPEEVMPAITEEEKSLACIALDERPWEPSSFNWTEEDMADESLVLPDDETERKTLPIVDVDCAAIAARVLYSQWTTPEIISSSYVISSQDMQIIDDLYTSFKQKGASHQALVTALQEMNQKHTELFQTRSQEKAKQLFMYAYQKFFDLPVEFPTATLPIPFQSDAKLTQGVFRVVATQGVQYDIVNAAQDQDHLHVYQVASQYNASEAINPSTPGIGDAMKSSKGDFTQGPQAQRTNPIAFELVLAFLTHLGFNMLENAIPSAGKTYDKASPVAHGYLCPNDQNLEILTQELQTNVSKAEYVCYASKVSPSGNPVYIFLQAAPAIGYAKNLSKPSDDLQRYATLANHLSLFQYGISLAKKSGQQVVLHVNAPGSGVFQNITANLQWGFHQAALMYGEEMKRYGVSVQLEAFQGKGPMKEIAQNLFAPLTRLFLGLPQIIPPIGQFLSVAFGIMHRYQICVHKIGSDAHKSFCQ